MERPSITRMTSQTSRRVLGKRGSWYGYVALFLSGLAVLALAGCGWTNHENPSPDQLFESSLRSYGLARSFGETAQAELSVDELGPATRAFIKSQRHASRMGDGEGQGEDQAEFMGDLQQLTLEWTSNNNQALKDARVGDRPAMRMSLRRADAIEEEMDVLLLETDFESLTDGAMNDRRATQLVYPVLRKAGQKGRQPS